jgi:hypothetical protein
MTIQYATHCIPGAEQVPDADPDEYLKMRVRHLNTVAFDPDWDPGTLQELLQ